MPELSGNRNVSVQFKLDDVELARQFFEGGSQTGLFMRRVGQVGVVEAKLLAKSRLRRKISGAGPANYHRGPNKFPKTPPGRTGLYDTKFGYRTSFGGRVKLSVYNASKYASVVEYGTAKVNYPIKPRNAKKLIYFSERGASKGTYVRSLGVTHPGPWRTRNPKFRNPNPLRPRGSGVGAFILTDATAIAWAKVAASYTPRAV